MKRLIGIVVLLAMLTGLSLAGCSKPSQPSSNGGTKAPAKKVVLLVNGTLGDKSFFDSANAGLERIKNELGCETKVIEMGTDPSKWEPTLTDVSGQDWDLIICGTWQMTENLEKVAPKFPNKRYVIFDTTVDYSKGNLNNVYSIQYSQNEGSYLAGALAAMVTTSNMPKANGKKLIGFLGGQNIDVINDFLVGYIEGAKSVVPDVKVAISYVDDFANPAKGKEQALAQYEMGCDIGFNVAGQSGLGQLDAAKEKDKYAIGVDSDQAMLFKDSDPQKANLILTSMLKRVDNSLFRAVQLFLQGNLPFGKCETLGLKEDAVGISENEFYVKNVPEEIRQKLSDIRKKIESGEIKVDSIFTMDKNAFQALVDSVRP